MPTVYTEHLVDIQTSEAADIELSPYQTQLNRVYRIASPMLENIYSIRYSIGTSSSEMAQTVEQIGEAMRLWSRDLPTSLDLDQYSDLPSRSSLQEKMHQLQSLSLRLTFLNLKIIIHRPLLADWGHRRRHDSRTSRNGYATDDAVEKQTYDASFEQCLSAALAISRLGQDKPNLILLAGRTHLLSFLAMNIFTSSVVLFICALSDVLSNAAQEAKRGMSRNLKILKSVSTTGSLSSQCGTIVEDLIQMILGKEKDEMLLGPLQTDEQQDGSGPVHHHHDHLITVPIEHASNPHTMSASQYHDFSVHTNALQGGSGATFGSTMQQLQRGTPYRKDFLFEC